MKLVLVLKNKNYILDMSPVNKIDKKAIVKNRYYKIPHPALNTKRERGTYNKDGTKTKTAQMKSQGGSTLPIDGHTAMLNKLNSK